MSKDATSDVLLTSALKSKIVRLVPPIITSKTILQKLTCTRPVREGFFRIGVEKIGTKTATHIYGHGGSGWTVVFGSVNRAIREFEVVADKHEPIRIIGSGCMGLTAAVELARRGYRVAGITTQEKYDLASWRAAGYFALCSLKTASAEQAAVNDIGADTFQTLKQIAAGKHPYIAKEAVRYMPVYCHKDTESGVEDLEERGLLPPPERVTLDFGNGVQHPDYIKHMTYFIDTTKVMRTLIDEVGRLNISIEEKTVSSFEDVKEKVLFNCTGLGARELNGDNTFEPVRGHLFVLSEEAGAKHMDYMIFTKVVQEGHQEHVYLFPKSMSVTATTPQGVACHGIIGGTFIPHLDHLSPKELAARDEEEFNKMLKRSRAFFYGKI
jgi:D-amino-acid oxidase